MKTQTVIYIISNAIYNLYFHPLATFPGPWYGAISNLFYIRTVIGGSAHHELRKLHDEYGEVVRWAPNDVSFSAGAAWKDIYVPRRSGKVFLKDPTFYVANQTSRPQHLVTTIDGVQHAQAKSILSQAFSRRALLEQEGTVVRYVDMLMDAISEEGRKGPIDIKDFYNWVTFDILGELCFSESFGSVQRREADGWVATVLSVDPFFGYDVAAYRFSPIFEAILSLLVIFAPWQTGRNLRNHIGASKAKIMARMKREPERKDFCSYIFEIRDKRKLSDTALVGYSNAMILAGSGTTSVTLSALTHWICRNPRVYEKLKEEVRSSFHTADEITSQSASLPYLTAVINEALRIFPPFPFVPPRMVPKSGETVAGVFIPGDTRVGVHMWSTTRNPKNFKNPDAFLPERWLDPHSGDDLNASQPFLLGPRACIGQNMAWMQLRILVAKIVFLFDFELVDKEIDWGRDASPTVLWSAPKLMVKVVPK
ncbi:Cytochrome P450 monooxygenase hmp1 [Lachnellula arida]|uniref:Cytochrome P450 monooxygenase hmp1 n=1 Tax=Lachnellula arida TaxID=1316785 RepID=A0A8T9B6F5_9HELO|nr:Cytochrome P450 monooxygenase hmp1 [Lachnellula arida]